MMAKKVGILAPLCGMVGVLALSSCSGGKESAGGDRKVAAAAATLRDAVRLSGTVEPVVSVDLKAEVSGRIVDLPAREGDKVAKGDLLVKLDPEPFQLKVDRARLAVDRALLAEATSVRDVERAEALVATGTVSRDALQDQRTALAKVRLDLRDARLQLREAMKDLSDAHVRAPMDGRLISLNVEEGEMAVSAVSASGGTALGVVADPNRMMVEVEVGELDFPRVKLGMPVEVSSGVEGGGTLRGKVTFVSSSARASAGSSSIQVFPVEVTLDTGVAAPRRHGSDRDSARKGRERNGAAGKERREASPGAGGGLPRPDDSSANVVLVPGMTVAVDFVFMEREVPVAVPPAAVVRKGPRALVRVQGPDGEIEERQVRVGATDFRRVEILEGLQAGDTVLVAETSRGDSRGPGGRR
ncbi:MAG: efflux RND transporter periplasmic adaptor subunit [Fibrobacteria bacterium]|nr:efflux RND transporter periplasmic adaptor subunit [Fibrobacteria bacterium]